MMTDKAQPVAEAVMKFGHAPEGKRLRLSINWDKCLCHGFSSSVGKLEKFTQTSWQKFCQAATRRQDGIYDLFKDYIDGEEPLPKDVTQLVKHHNCYASYVLEKSINRLERTREETVSDISVDTEPPQRTTRSTTPACLRVRCVICQEAKRLVTNRRKHEALHPLTLISAMETITKAAEIRKDERVLMELRGGARGAADPIAGDILIHRSCRSSYTHKRTLLSLQKSSTEDQERDQYDRAFDVIADEVNARVINGMEVLQMSDLLQQYIQVLGDFGTQQPDYRSEKLKKRLRKEFSNTISFWHPRFRRGCEVVFCDVPPGLILDARMAASSKLDDDKIEDNMQLSDDMERQDGNELYHAALLVKTAIMQVEDMTWPPSPEHISSAAAEAAVPPCLFNLLAWIATGDASLTYEAAVSLDVPANVPKALKTRILSIAQDIIYITRKGRIRTPKHVSLAVSVHHKTGSMQLVSTLNRFGHCISKSKLQEVETALAEHRLQQQHVNVVPSNIAPNVPVTFVWDNNDIREETATGKGTTHCTNGIVVQAAVSGCRPKMPEARSTPKGRRRSVQEKPRHLLEYRMQVTSASSCNDERFDGVVLVTDSTEKLTGDLTVLKAAIVEYAKLDTACGEEIVVLHCPKLISQRLVFSPTGPLNRDYDDIRRFSDAACAGVKRALKAGLTKPLLVCPPDSLYDHATMVATLGALHAIYVPLEVQEALPDKSTKVNLLGIWTSTSDNAERLIEVVSALEAGRALCRDIGGSDPERMTPPRVYDYVNKMFINSNVKVSVITDPAIFEKDFPCLAAVNRCANVVSRHRGHLIELEYVGDGPTSNTLFLIGKGITYDTGGADIKAGGGMAGMHRDKCGAAAVAGFFKVLAELKPKNIKVVGAMAMVRNSVGADCYVSDEIIRSRAGKRIRVGNTDAEGRMVMADVLCMMKERALTAVNPQLFTIATLTGHAVRAVGPNYSIILDNGPARKTQTAQSVQKAGDQIGDPFEVSTIRREDFEFHKGKSEYEDVLQANNLPSSSTPRGHQAPAAFLIMASGLDAHGRDSDKPLPYSHLDIAGSSGPFPGIPTGAPIAALAGHYILGQVARG